MSSGKIYFYICIILILLSNWLIANTYNNDNCFEFLKYLNDADNLSLNFSNITQNYDNGLILLNPSLIPHIPRDYFYTSYSRMFLEQSIENIAYSTPLKYGYITLGFLKSNIEDTNFEALTIKNSVFKNCPRSNLYYCSYGVKIYENLVSGLSVKYATEKIENYEYKRFLFDFGLLYNIRNEFKVGFSLLNVSDEIQRNNVDYAPPLTVMGGLSYTTLQTDNLKLILFFSGGKIRGEDLFNSIGLQFLILDSVKINCGYSNRDGYDKNLSLGIDFILNNMNLKFSNAKFKDYGSIQTISLSFLFGEIKKESLEVFNKIMKPDEIKCNNCGNIYSSNYNYCPVCGFPSVGLVKTAK